MVFDADTKSVLHTEMAKKNLFVKRGEVLIQLEIVFSVLVVSCSQNLKLKKFSISFQFMKSFDIVILLRLGLDLERYL